MIGAASRTWETKGEAGAVIVCPRGVGGNELSFDVATPEDAAALTAFDNLSSLDLDDERAKTTTKASIACSGFEHTRVSTYSCGSMMQSGHSETVRNQSGTAPCCLRSKGRHLPSVLRLCTPKVRD